MVFCHKLFRKDYAGKSDLKRITVKFCFYYFVNNDHVPLYYDRSTPITNSNSVSVYLEI